MELIVLLILLSIAIYSAMAVLRWILEIIISLCNWFLGRPNHDYFTDHDEINNKKLPIKIQFIVIVIVVFVIGYILGKL
jgi:hypothetical protein